MQNPSYTTLTDVADSHCRIRDVATKFWPQLQARAAERWASATHAHYNLDLRFNSQSLIVAMTERLAIGGRAWPSVVFEQNQHEYAFALWCNSTLGLLCHWWMANKTQAGRGCTTVTGIKMIPTLDVHALSEQQHAKAKRAFDELMNKQFLPFNQIDKDPARQDLDRLLLIEVLGLDPLLCRPDGPMGLLRRKLATEPQISGDKKTKVEFTD